MMSVVKFINLMLLYSNMNDVYSQYTVCYHGNNPQPCNISCNNNSCNGNNNWSWNCQPRNNCNFNCDNDCNNGGNIIAYSRLTVDCNDNSCHNLGVSCQYGLLDTGCDINCYNNSCNGLILYCWPETNCTINCDDDSSCLNANMKCDYNNCFTQGINGDEIIIEEGWTHYGGPTPEPTNTPTKYNQSSTSPTMFIKIDPNKQNPMNQILPILFIVIGCVIILIICVSILLIIIKIKIKSKTNVQYIDNQNIKNTHKYISNETNKEYNDNHDNILHSIEGNPNEIISNIESNQLNNDEIIALEYQENLNDLKKLTSGQIKPDNFKTKGNNSDINNKNDFIIADELQKNHNDLWGLTSGNIKPKQFITKN